MRNAVSHNITVLPTKRVMNRDDFFENVLRVVFSSRVVTYFEASA